MAIDFKQIKFFIEGDGDWVLVRDLLKLWYGLELSKEGLKSLLIICGGYNGINSQADEFRQTNVGQKREGGKNIVIFDADFSERAEHHGFKEKTAYLEQKKNELNIEFETFLFPNNANDGTIETLLETCINPAHLGIMDCWNGFEVCVRSLSERYTIPAGKSKIYVYLECIHSAIDGKKEKIKDKDRDFTEIDKWVMDYNKNPYLKKLKTFLDGHLQAYEI